MADPFDVRALIGRTFGEVLDEITPWDGVFGFGEGGPITAAALTGGGGPPLSEEATRAREAVKRKTERIVAELRQRAVELVDVDGAVVPRWVWFSGRWRFYRRRGVEWLQVLTEAGRTVKRYSPAFARPTAEGGDKKPAPGGKRGGKRGGGNTGYDDTADVELARAEFKVMTKPSKIGAARTVVDRRIAAGHPVASTSTPEQWARRIAREL